MRAGLIPAFRQGKHATDDELSRIHIITPTTHPLQTLAASLTRGVIAENRTTTLAGELQRSSQALQRYLHQQLDHNRTERFLLVVDQFEELFTLCRSKGERRAFVNNLMALVTTKNAVLTPVVLVLRADFYAHCAEYSQLRQTLAAHQEYIGPMSRDELRRAIEEPARLVGWEFERGVVELLIRDVGDEPGALPLLSHALLETWRHRRGRTMTLESYAEAGTVQGAIAKTAEAVYRQRLSAKEQAIARNIFLRLTELGEGTQDTRRRVAMSELMSDPTNANIVASVLQTLVEARLVVTSERSVEVAHEALIREWPALRHWLDENREGLRIHRHLTEATQEWVALQQDSGELYRGPRLAQAVLWAETHGDALNAVEREFLEASRGLQQKEEAERIAQQQRDLEHAQALAVTEAKRAEEQTYAAYQLRRRAIFLAGALAIAAVLALAAFLFGRQANRNATTARDERTRADQQRDIAVAAEGTAQSEKVRADQERDSAISAQATAIAEKDRADQQARMALSRHLTAQLLSHLDDLDLALLLSLEANRIMSNTYEIKNSLLTALESSSRLVKLLHGHAARAYSVAFSPNGKVAVSGSEDGTIIFWDINTRQPIGQPLTGHTDWVTGIAFSSDGKIVASASREIILWDVETRRPIGHPFTNHTRLIWGLAIHPNGKILASGSSDQTIMLWNIEDPANPTLVGIPLTGHTDEVRSLAFSPKDEILASGSWDNSIILWDIGDLAHTKPISQPLQAHSDWVRSVAFSPDGNILASGSADDTVILWDMSKPENVKPIGQPLSGHSNLVYSVAFTADGTKLVSSSADKFMTVWDVSDPANPKRLEQLRAAQPGTIQSVAISSEGLLLSANNDGSLALWDLTTRQQLGHMIGQHSNEVNEVAFSPDGKLLASASDDGTVILWDVNTPNAPQPIGKPLQKHTGIVNTVAFSPDGSILASAGEDRSIVLWNVVDPDHPKLIGQPLLQHNDFVGSLAFSPDGTMLASGSNDDTIIVWDIKNSSQPITASQTLRGHSDDVLTVNFSSDSRILAAGDAANNIFLWDIQSHKQIAELKGHSWRVWGVDFSPNGQILASGGQDNVMILWDIQQILASKPQNDEVTKWDILETPAIGQMFTSHANTVSSVAFNSSGTMLASGSVDQTVILWDMANRQPLGLPLSGHSNTIDSVAFSPDGKYLASGSYDGTVILWDISFESWQRRACEIANRNMSQEEWRQYFGSAEYRKTCPDLPLHPSFTQPLIEQGRKLAQKGDIQGGIAQFEEALKVEPTLNLDPISEANHYAATGLVDQGRNLARDGDIDSAIDKFAEALKLDPRLNIEPKPSAHLEYARSLVASGTYSQVMPVIGLVEAISPTLNITLTLSANQWNEICWRGNLAGLSIDVLPACNRAVTLTPYACNMFGNRGVARAMLNDIEGAIDDLTVYVSCAEEANYDVSFIQQRASWLEILKAGKNIIPGHVFVWSRKFAEAIAVYNDVQSLAPNIQISVHDWNLLCWRGSLYGFANKVLVACEKAVALAPEDIDIRDSRALARALVGNTQGAIKDFEFVVKQASEQGWSSDFVVEREGWLTQLKAGKNPFDAATLEKLRNE